MRIVHLSDLHLGFRQYQRQTPTGINQREADVAETFRRAIDAIIALAPDMVLIAGDVFHVVRPANPAILHAFIQLSRLVRELPEVRVVIAAGNHDLPKTSEAGCILHLFARLDRIQVATFKPERFSFPELGASVLAVPDLQRPALTLDPAARHNILLLHGMMQGFGPAYLTAEDRAAREISLSEITQHPWDYIALGNYHVYTKVARNAYYSGSIEYTSLNPWGDLLEQKDLKVPGKGFIEHDLSTGEHRFHTLTPARELIDLPAIQAAGMTAAELDDAIRRTVDALTGGVDDRVVRLVIRDVPRHVVRELDHRALREYRKRALHFQLDPRKPEIVRRDVSGAPGRRATLADIVRDNLGTRPLPADVPRDVLVALGLEYLTAAEQLETAPALAGGADMTE